MTINKYLEKIEDLSNHKIALTGGTSGVGLQLFFHLVKKNAYIVLLVRNVRKGQAIIDSLGYKNIDLIEYDQASFKSIENGVDALLKKHPDVDTIVLNAGELSKKGITEEGYSLTIGVNYFGVRHFIEYISPKLTNKVRFVVQGSIVAGSRVSKKDDLTRLDYGVFKQYNLSKGYLESYIHKLVVDNKYPNLDYVLTEPGITSTNITRHFNAFIRKGGRIFLTTFFSSPRVASLTLLTGISNLASNGDFITPRGLFTMLGYPKIKKFPHKRERSYLFE